MTRAWAAEVHRSVVGLPIDHHLMCVLYYLEKELHERRPNDADEGQEIITALAAVYAYRIQCLRILGQTTLVRELRNQKAVPWQETDLLAQALRVPTRSSPIDSLHLPPNVNPPAPYAKPPMPPCPPMATKQPVVRQFGPTEVKPQGWPWVPDRPRRHEANTNPPSDGIPRPPAPPSPKR